nr:hypothetical protein [Suttonella ornithocola]
MKTITRQDGRKAITSKIDCSSETLRAWYNKHAALATPGGVQAQDALERIKSLSVKP